MLWFIAVGFKVSEFRSIFYFKKSAKDPCAFFSELQRKVLAQKPDFVSMRFIWEESE